MIQARAISGTRLREFRGLITVFVLFMYLAAGVLHSISHLDVAGPLGETIVSAANSHDDGRQTEEGVAAGHHCHGCFSVAPSNPPVAVLALEIKRDLIVLRDVDRYDSPTGIDPPPPKYLT